MIHRATESPTTPALTLPATQLHRPLTGVKLDYSAIKRNRNRSTNVEISGQTTNKQIINEHQNNVFYTTVTAAAAMSSVCAVSSGSMPDCSVRGPEIESRCGQLCLSHNHCDLQPWAWALCTLLQCLGQLSLLPSVGW